ncbi:MAG: DUF4421 family protein [Bacteroidaceae bacterium]|nr:DUF4421 family protein [Bacteroidaceae bacterium]
MKWNKNILFTLNHVIEEQSKQSHDSCRSIIKQIQASGHRQGGQTIMHRQSHYSSSNAIKILCTIICFVFCCHIHAQESYDDNKNTLIDKRKIIKEQIDSVLQAKYDRVSYDTNYISRPQTHLTLKVRANVSGNSIHQRGTIEGDKTKADLKTDHKATLSVSASYLGITAGLAINPSSLSGRSKDYELNINAYNNRYSIDASYQMSKTLAGDMYRGGTTHHIERGYIDMKTLNITGCYIFNHRRFSYPAAFTQSYIQKKSAGSWLAGISYQGGRIETTDQAAENFPESRIYIGHFGIGGGYGYNLVVKNKWLFHLSTMPTLVLINRNNVTINGERRDMHTKFPDMIFNEHIAIIRNFSAKYFAGATLVVSNTLFNDDNIDINQNKWLSRLFFGIRL